MMWRIIYAAFSTLEKYGTVVGTDGADVIAWLTRLLVLLMDEADVFLEERTMADLQRNSLVSGTFLKKNNSRTHH